MSKTKIVRFPPWQTKNDTGIEKRYIRIGVTMTSSEVFRNLSSSAVRIYINMMMESGGSKNFKFPYNKYSSYMSKPTFFRARDELIKYGFIEIVHNNRNLRKANEYCFSEKWKSL
jgi:hypothetical protein